MNIIDGQALAYDIRSELRKKIISRHLQPGLAIILIGDDEASKKYVSLKQKASEEIGIIFHLYKFPSDVHESAIEETIDFLNADDEIDGILIQLPLPSHLNADTLVNRIDPKKDADGFHKENLKRFFNKRDDAEAPGLVASIMTLIEQTDISVQGSVAYILANSPVFPLAMTEMLERKGARVQTLLKPSQKDLSQLKDADIIIVIIGKKLFIEAGNTKNNAVIIDAGYNRDSGELCGDAHTQSFHDTDVWITPVPGGVGPMTVAMLLKHTIELYEKNHKI